MSEPRPEPRLVSLVGFTRDERRPMRSGGPDSPSYVTVTGCQYFLALDTVGRVWVGQFLDSRLHWEPVGQEFHNVP